MRADKHGAGGNIYKRKRFSRCDLLGHSQPMKSNTDTRAIELQQFSFFIPQGNRFGLSLFLQRPKIFWCVALLAPDLALTRVPLAAMHFQAAASILLRLNNLAFRSADSLSIRAAGPLWPGGGL